MRTAPLALSVVEAAKAISLSRSTLYRLIATRQLATFRLGGRRLVHRDDLEKLLDEARQTHPAK